MSSQLATRGLHGGRGPHDEDMFLDAFAALRERFGSHAPSVASVQATLGRPLTVDACFISNAYATDVAVCRLTAAMLDEGQLRRLVECYPTPASGLVPPVASMADVDPDMLFLGNGATEAIRAALGTARRRVLLPIPTFSPYYEFASGEVVFHRSLETDAEQRANELLELAHKTRPDVVVVINPNNPDGFAYEPDRLTRLLADLSQVCGEILLDESFAGLALDGPPPSRRDLVDTLPNLVVIRSLSKEYGIAGLRLGYAIARPERIRELNAGVLWNLNGFAEHFIRSLQEPSFREELATARHRYMGDVAQFLQDIQRLPHVTALPSRTNFVLLRLAPHLDPYALVGRLLYRHGVYIRPCSDKVGLDASYVRVAAGRTKSNELVIDALSSCLG